MTFTEASYIIRQGVSYQRNLEKIWIDVEVLEKYIIIGNEYFGNDNKVAKEAYKLALELYDGIYLPNRIYEDWSSEEREKIQLLVLGAYISLAEILLKENPLESIRLAQNAISIDPTWEDAYRLQMNAYLAKVLLRCPLTISFANQRSILSIEPSSAFCFKRASFLLVLGINCIGSRISPTLK